VKLVSTSTNSLKSPYEVDLDLFLASSARPEMVRPRHSNDAVSITDAPVRRDLMKHLRPKRHYNQGESINCQNTWEILQTTYPVEPREVPLVAAVHAENVKPRQMCVVNAHLLRAVDQQHPCWVEIQKVHRFGPRGFLKAITCGTFNRSLSKKPMAQLPCTPLQQSTHKELAR
jgi:hypothetical protein